jgi:hypothetical protein
MGVKLFLGQRDALGVEPPDAPRDQLQALVAFLDRRTELAFVIDLATDDPERLLPMTLGVCLPIVSGCPVSVPADAAIVVRGLPDPGDRLVTVELDRRPARQPGNYRGVHLLVGPEQQAGEVADLAHGVPGRARPARNRAAQSARMSLPT